MKSLLIILIGVLTIGATLPAIAGPDWQLIEQSRKAKLVRMQQEKMASQTKSSGSSTPETAQPVDKDAGHDKMMKECMKDCMDMMKK